MNGSGSGVLRVTRTVRWDPTSWTPSASRCPRTYCTLGVAYNRRDDTVPVRTPMFDGRIVVDTGRSEFGPWWDPGGC